MHDTDVRHHYQGTLGVGYMGTLCTVFAAFL